MAYHFSARAAEDLYLIYEDGKRQFGERSAEIYYSLMLDAADFASRHPLASPVRQQLSMAVRVRYFGSHLLVYEINDPDIVILRILHQAQDWPEHL